MSSEVKQACDQADALVNGRTKKTTQVKHARERAGFFMLGILKHSNPDDISHLDAGIPSKSTGKREFARSDWRSG